MNTKTAEVYTVTIILTRMSCALASFLEGTLHLGKGAQAMFLPFVTKEDS